MMKYNPEIHHRRSIRLKGYNYAQEGLYFLTLCIKNKKHVFGYVQHGEMVLNKAGAHANDCWLNIPKYFPNVKLHKYVIMPNHIHGIIEITFNTQGTDTTSPSFSSFKSPSRTVGSIVRGFKTGVTKWFRKHWPHSYPIGTDVWQRDYYESIIRDDQSYQNRTNYIINNPVNWPDRKN